MSQTTQPDLGHTLETHLNELGDLVAELSEPGSDAPDLAVRLSNCLGRFQIALEPFNVLPWRETDDVLG